MQHRRVGVCSAISRIWRAQYDTVRAVRSEGARPVRGKAATDASSKKQREGFLPSVSENEIRSGLGAHGTQGECETYVRWSLFSARGDQRYVACAKTGGGIGYEYDCRCGTGRGCTAWPAPCQGTRRSSDALRLAMTTRRAACSSDASSSRSVSWRLRLCGREQ